MAMLRYAVDGVKRQALTGGYGGRAAKQLEWILSSRLSSDVLRKSATKLLRNGRQPWVFALHLLRRLDESAVRPDLISFGAAQDTLAHSKHSSAWQHALAVLVEVQLRRLSVDAALMAVAIHACRQRWRQAFALLADATRRSLFSDVARSSSILACGVALQWRRALAILTDSSTSAHRIPCSAATYSSAMCAMESATQWQHALEILRLAIEEAQRAA
ncbi:unnamed protein product [Cladocopium goreaui]|uniref:Pentacotripeptide-repeat region of PRORP domain-containing protein n=1 Tax=Cladocopium goreaui TaxID=2562237 RepID=A0A9P1FTX4_9DINO|nr:unnamed protein product [Cladocopium goreaui]